MVSLSPLLDSYDQVIIDLDGCVRVGDQAVPGSPEAVAALRGAGKRVAFATNNSWQSGEDQVRQLWALGIQASLADVVTVGGAVQHLLAETLSGRSAFVVGSETLSRHVSGAGLRLVNGTGQAAEAEVVVVGGTDQVGYADLRDAALSARRGARFLGTARDPTLPMPEGPWPGTGAILAAIEIASDCTAEIVGKPSPRLMETAVDRLGEGRTLVIGDRLDSDVAAAGAAGLDAALVLSGPGTGEAAEGGPRPVAIAETLAALVGLAEA
ncbi:MAG: HAD-IIA family hydrolase [Thermoleophilaceae bacterium]